MIKIYKGEMIYEKLLL